jgi:hypothetical protein
MAKFMDENSDVGFIIRQLTVGEGPAAPRGHA